MCPPVREHTSISRARISSASVCSSSRVKLRKSAGDWIRSRIDIPGLKLANGSGPCYGSGVMIRLRATPDDEMCNALQYRREKPDTTQRCATICAECLRTPLRGFEPE